MLAFSLPSAAPLALRAPLAPGSVAPPLRRPASQHTAAALSAHSAVAISLGVGVVLRRASNAASPEVKGPKGQPAPKLEPPWEPNQETPTEELGVTAPIGYFDPMGIAPKDKETFYEYRACEIKHGRVAMMASIGAVGQHFLRFPGFEKTQWGEVMPSGFMAAFNNPGSFGLVLLSLLAGALEFTVWSEDYSKREPGNFGDPLGLNQYTEDMRNRELNNGRFAMVAILGIVAAELATGKDAVEQLGF